MDPIAIVTGVAQVGIKLAGIIKEVRERTKDVPQELSDWQGQIEAFNEITRAVQKEDFLRTAEVCKILERCLEKLDRIAGDLAELQTELDSLVKKTWSAVCGEKKEDDIRKKFSAFAEELGPLQIQLQLLSSKRTQDKLDTVHRNQERYHVQADVMNNGTDEEKCLKALFCTVPEVTNPKDDRAGLLTSKGQIVEGTCDWIVNKSEFIEWERKRGILWISGGPGLGKTMLSIHLTRHIEDMSTSDHEQSQQSTTIYFFCNSSQRSSGISLIRGLISQLLHSNGALYKHILPDFKARGTSIFESNQSSFETLWRMFIAMVHENSLGNVSCILDGLDECDKEWLEVLTIKIKELPSIAPRLGLIVVSREYPTCLSNSMGNSPRICLDPDSKDEINAGLELYIASQMAELTKTSNGRFPPTLLQKVEKTIRKKCDGTYLWISFAIKELQTKEPSEVEEVLRGMPKGLDDMYARMLNQIDESRRDVAERLLRWCTFLRGTLTLGHVVGVLIDACQGGETLDPLEAARGFVAYCGHLLSIEQSQSIDERESIYEINSYKIKSLKITFVHQSVRDFLTRTVQSKTVSTWLAPFEPTRENAVLASECLGYIKKHHDSRFPWFLAGRDSISADFLKYALQNWFRHTREAGNAFGPDFLNKHSKILANEHSKELRVLLDGNEGLYNRYEGPTGLLGLACYAGIEHLVKQLVQARTKPFRRLPRAVYHLRVFKASDYDIEGLSPLHIAVREGLISIVKALIDSGADINQRGYDPRKKGLTPLSTIVSSIPLHHNEMAAFLLQNGADPNAGFPPTISLVAEKFWNKPREKIQEIRLLLKYGADVRKRGVQQRNALHEALRATQGSRHSFSGDPWPAPLGILRLNVRNSMYEAHGGGILDVLEVLACAPHGREAARAVDVDGETVFLLATRSMAAHYDNPAEWGAERAAQARDRRCLRWLLDPSMGISHLLGRRNKHGENVLHIASHLGKAEVELFLKAGEGLDVTARDYNGDTPLHRAADLWNTDVIKALLATGRVIDVNCVNKHGQTPLHLLATSNYWRRHFYSGATDLPELDCGTEALESQIRDSLRALVRSGADLKARDLDRGETACEMIAEGV
ncbi:hypothetical protein MCOR02_000934 [Pyricularia oryzae]|nr:hypothetical protein MCOR02_000934 [Pyricularia oryzae]KAI6452651.1 hypothetical protein MCOR17_009477 [Pyricularia oryzae]KAI6505129.1 hypothetical protein MCOR13_004461 [Pyricularia oryzae]